MDDAQTVAELRANGWTLDQALDNFVGKVYPAVTGAGKTPVVWQEMASLHLLASQDARTDSHRCSNMVYWRICRGRPLSISGNHRQMHELSSTKGTRLSTRRVTTFTWSVPAYPKAQGLF